MILFVCVRSREAQPAMGGCLQNVASNRKDETMQLEAQVMVWLIWRSTALRATISLRPFDLCS
jgi:hypothetical protein